MKTGCGKCWLKGKFPANGRGNAFCGNCVEKSDNKQILLHIKSNELKYGLIKTGTDLKTYDIHR